MSCEGHLPVGAAVELLPWTTQLVELSTETKHRNVDGSKIEIELNSYKDLTADSVSNAELPLLSCRINSISYLEGS